MLNALPTQEKREVKAVVLGSGNTAVELISILKKHPHVRLTGLRSSRAVVGLPAGTLDGLAVQYENLDPQDAADKGDVVFSCAEDAVAMDYAPATLAAGKKFIDFGGAFRLRDPALAEQWYKNTNREVLAQAVYGQPELFPDQIRKARLIANPGCYPTAVLLAVSPLLKCGIVDTRQAIGVVAISGYSGAGGSYQPTHGVRPYKTAEHRHRPEIKQICNDYVALQRQDVSGEIRVLFSPHINDDVERGIEAHVTVQPKRRIEEGEVRDVLEQAYAGERLIQVVDHEPDVRDVIHTDLCQIAAWVQDGAIKLISVIDNVRKGASGQAVQNMNLLFGLEKNEGLRPALTKRSESHSCGSPAGEVEFF